MKTIDRQISDQIFTWVCVEHGEYTALARQLWGLARKTIQSRGWSPETPIREMEISVRAFNCLDNEAQARARETGKAFPVTLGDVRRMSDAELLRIPNFGRITLREIRAIAPFQGPDLDAVESPVDLHAVVKDLRMRVEVLETLALPGKSD